MRRIWLLVFSLLVFLSSISLVLDLLSFNISFAQEISPTPIPAVDYELPYPGLLPDSPLYIFRIIRDKIVEFLISDPLKKTEFNLLQADKRLNAGIYLLNKKKISLALSTISKAENYFEKALSKLREAKIQGKNINGIEGRIRTALKKHRQELKDIVRNARADFKQDFEKELKRMDGFEKRLNKEP